MNSDSNQVSPHYCTPPSHQPATLSGPPFKTIDDIIYYMQPEPADDMSWSTGNKVYIPPDSTYAVRKYLLYTYHEASGHMGVKSTLITLRRSYWWSTLKQDVEAYVVSCAMCASLRQEATKAVQKNPTTRLPLRERFYSICIDHITQTSIGLTKPVKILTVIDEYTLLCMFVKTKSEGATDTIDALRAWISIFGYPAQIRLDNGPSFTSSDFKEYCAKSNINLKFTATANPKANLAERANRFLRQILNLMVLRGEQAIAIDEYLAHAQLLWNNNLRETGYSASQLGFGMNVNYIPFQVEINKLSGLTDENFSSDVKVDEIIKNMLLEYDYALGEKRSYQAAQKAPETPPLPLKVNDLCLYDGRIVKVVKLLNSVCNCKYIDTGNQVVLAYTSLRLLKDVQERPDFYFSSNLSGSWALFRASDEKLYVGKILHEVDGAVKVHLYDNTGNPARVNFQDFLPLWEKLGSFKRATKQPKGWEPHVETVTTVIARFEQHELSAILLKYGFLH